MTRPYKKKPAVFSYLIGMWKMNESVDEWRDREGVCSRKDLQDMEAQNVMQDRVMINDVRQAVRTEWMEQAQELGPEVHILVIFCNRFYYSNANTTKDTETAKRWLFFPKFTPVVLPDRVIAVLCNAPR